MTFTTIAEDAIIERIILEQTGFLPEEFLTNYRLQNTDSNRNYTPKRKVERVIEFGDLPRLETGRTATYKILADLSPDAPANTTFGIKLGEFDDATVETIRGTEIPLTGRSATNVASGTVAGSGDNSLAVDLEQQAEFLLPGTNNVRLAKIELTSQTEAIEVSEITFTVSGVDPAEVFAKPHLIDHTGRVIAENPQINGNKLTFQNPFGVTNDSPPISFVVDIPFTAEFSRTPSVSISDAAEISSRDIAGGFVTEATGDFPLQTPAMKLLERSERNEYVSINRLPLRGKEVKRGETEVPLLQLELLAHNGDARIDRLQLLYNQSFDRLLTEGFAQNAAGQKYCATITEQTFLIKDPIRLSENVPMVLTFYANIRPDAQLNELFHLLLEGETQVSATAMGESAPVVASFPLAGDSFEVVTDDVKMCTMQYDPVCGRVYDACADGVCAPEDVTYGNLCQLQVAEAFYKADGECSTATNPNSFVPSGDGFNDVSNSNPSFSAIEYLRDEAIVEGFDDNTFRPEKEISRAAFTKIIIEAEFSATEIGNCDAVPFSDTPASEWFTPYVCVAVRNDILNGFPDGTFRPGKSVSFAEAAKILAIAYESGVLTADPWYRPYIEFLADQNAIPTSLTAPAENITRAEMAEMIWRLREGITNKPSAAASGF